MITSSPRFLNIGIISCNLAPVVFAYVDREEEENNKITQAYIVTTVIPYSLIGVLFSYREIL